jgi:hypothetical protein
MTVPEVLNFVFAHLLDGVDGENRKRVMAALEGRLGPGGGIIVDDDTLPKSLQGQEAPSWWADEHDPFADTFTVDG